jgi:hypothetical protein
LIAADPFRDGVQVLIAGPPGFERTVAFGSTKHPKHRTPRRAPAHGCRAEEAVGGCPEGQGKPSDCSVNGGSRALRGRRINAGIGKVRNGTASGAENVALNLDRRRIAV